MAGRAFLGSFVVAVVGLAGSALGQPPRGSFQPAPGFDNSFKVIEYVAPVFAERPESPRDLVVVRVDVAADGKVTDVVGVAGPQDHVTAARDALRQWVFTAPPGGATQLFVGFNPAAQQSMPERGLRSPVEGFKKIRDVKPRYPAEAQKQRIQGKVLVDSVIDANGLVTSARVVQGDTLLAMAALEAVLQWRFTPAGVAIKMVMTTNFSMQNR